MTQEGSNEEAGGLTEEEVLLLVGLRCEEVSGRYASDRQDRHRMDDLEGRATREQLGRVESWVKFGIDLYSLADNELAAIARVASEIIVAREATRRSLEKSDEP